MKRFKQFLEVIKIVDGNKMLIAVKEEFPISIDARSASAARQELGLRLKDGDEEATEFRVVIDITNGKIYMVPSDKALHMSVALFFKIPKNKEAMFIVDFHRKSLRFLASGLQKDFFPIISPKFKDKILMFFKGLKITPKKITFR